MSLPVALQLYTLRDEMQADFEGTIRKVKALGYDGVEFAGLFDKSAADIKAPMPGTINAVKVSAGQAVKKGDVLVILEAMKMENEIAAPCDGVVASVNVTKGATVSTGDLLISLN